MMNKTIESIMHEAENKVIDLRGCSRETARTYLSEYLRDKEQGRIDEAQATIAAYRTRNE